MAFIVAMGCASAPAQSRSGVMAPDSFDAATRIYRNEGAGFRLKLPATWIVFDSVDLMPLDARAYAQKLRDAGAEMIFVARGPSEMYLRGIVEPTSMDPATYFKLVEQANRAGLLSSAHTQSTIGGQTAIRWVYEAAASGTRLKFVEYQFLRNQFNVRISFWTQSSVFKSRETEFEHIMESCQSD